MEHYKISFTANGKTIEISSHEKDWVESKEKQYEDMIETLLSSPIPIHSTPTTTSQKSETTKKNEIAPSITINEFYRKYLHDSKISSRPDIATFFVYYLVKIKKQEEISPADVKNCFKDASYPNWNKINISDVLSNAKKKAFLNYHNNQWSLTITGEDFVINSLSEINEQK